MVSPGQTNTRKAAIEMLQAPCALHIRLLIIAGILASISLLFPQMAHAKDSITITFDSNGGENIWNDGEYRNTKTTVSRKYTGEIILPRYIESSTLVTPGARPDKKLRFSFVREGCTSTGYWALNRYEPGEVEDDDGDEVIYFNGNTTFASPKDFRKAAGLPSKTKKVTLYALWNPATYNVRLDPNGAEQAEPVNQLRVRGSSQIIGNITAAPDPAAPSFTRKGYFLTSWNTEKDGSGKSYRFDEPFEPSADMQVQATTNEDYMDGPGQPDAEIIEADPSYVKYVKKQYKKGVFGKPYPVAQGGIAFKHDGTLYYCQLFVPVYAPEENAAKWLRDGDGKSGYKACLSILNTETGETTHTQISDFLGHGNSVDYDDASGRLVVSTTAAGQDVPKGQEHLRLEVPAFREFSVEFHGDGSATASLIGSAQDYPRPSDGLDGEHSKPYKFGKACNRTFTDEDGNTVYAIYDRAWDNQALLEYRWDGQLGKYTTYRTIELERSDDYEVGGLCAENLNRGFTGTLKSMMIQGVSVGEDGFYFTGEAGHGSALLAVYGFSGHLRYVRTFAGGENGIREIESISEVDGKWYLFSAYHARKKVHVLTCPKAVAAATLYAQWMKIPRGH